MKVFSLPIHKRIVRDVLTKRITGVWSIFREGTVFFFQSLLDFVTFVVEEVVNSINYWQAVCTYSARHYTKFPMNYTI